jgi:hypothetical protein
MKPSGYAVLDIKCCMNCGNCDYENTQEYGCKISSVVVRDNHWEQYNPDSGKSTHIVRDDYYIDNVHPLACCDEWRVIDE